MVTALADSIRRHNIRNNAGGCVLSGIVHFHCKSQRIPQVHNRLVSRLDDSQGFLFGDGDACVRLVPIFRAMYCLTFELAVNVRGNFENLIILHIIFRIIQISHCTGKINGRDIYFGTIQFIVL